MLVRVSCLLFGRSAKVHVWYLNIHLRWVCFWTKWKLILCCAWKQLANIDASLSTCLCLGPFHHFTESCFRSTMIGLVTSLTEVKPWMRPVVQPFGISGILAYILWASHLKWRHCSSGINRWLVVVCKRCKTDKNTLNPIQCYLFKAGINRLKENTVLYLSSHTVAVMLNIQVLGKTLHKSYIRVNLCLAGAGPHWGPNRCFLDSFSCLTLPQLPKGNFRFPWRPPRNLVAGDHRFRW